LTKLRDSIDWRLSEAIALRCPNVPDEALKMLVSGVFHRRWSGENRNVG
jgi:hypothetical protein